MRQYGFHSYRAREARRPWLLCRLHDSRLPGRGLQGCRLRAPRAGVLLATGERARAVWRTRQILVHFLSFSCVSGRSGVTGERANGRADPAQSQSTGQREQVASCKVASCKVASCKMEGCKSARRLQVAFFEVVAPPFGATFVEGPVTKDRIETESKRKEGQGPK